MMDGYEIHDDSYRVNLIVKITSERKMVQKEHKEKSVLHFHSNP
jgi:hypothetical protein